MPDKTPPKDLLDWLGLTAAPEFTRARALGAFASVILTLLLAGAIIAAFTLIGRTIFLNEPGNLGTGALIVALLGAPFLIWNTIIKHRALGFQKEGHLTDRISAAVDQLGAEKTVKEHLMNSAGKKVYEKNPDGTPDFARPVMIERTAPNIEVRTGGLLSLERISQDSVSYDQGRDHVRIMEILCTYIRNNAPASDAQISLREKYETETEHTSNTPGLTDAQFAERHNISPADDLEDYISVDAVKAWAQSLPPPREDIILALKIIGRRAPEQLRAEAAWPSAPTDTTTWVFDTPCPELPDAVNDQPLGKTALDTFMTALEQWKTSLAGFPGYQPDLRNTNLQGANLSRHILSGALLTNARMEGAFLYAARMEGAILVEARMEGAGLFEARMEGAILVEARMEGADLTGARTQGANLSWARMEGANLFKARMEGANLIRARMEGANLTRARMERAELGGTRMEGADLSAARMEGANLSEARMQGANLRAARMEGITSLKAATFQGAALRSVSLSTVPISQEQLDTTFGDASVTLPDGIAAPAHWPDWELGYVDFDKNWALWRANRATYTPPPKPGAGP